MRWKKKKKKQVEEQAAAKAACVWCGVCDGQILEERDRGARKGEEGR